LPKVFFIQPIRRFPGYHCDDDQQGLRGPLAQVVAAGTMTDTTAPPRPESATGPATGPASVGLIVILVGVTTLSPLAISIIIPSLPAISLDLGANLTAIQMVLSGYLFALAAGQLFVGPLSDRYGRRPVLLVGFTVFVLAGIACAFAPTTEWLVAGRIIQGLGGSAGIVVTRAVVRDLHGREQAASVLGYVTMGMAVPPMVGPMFGGLINDAWGWQAVFGFIASAGLLVLIVVWFKLPETNTNRAGRTIASLAADARELIAIPVFWAFNLTSALSGGVYFAFMAGAPFIASVQLGLGPAHIGALLLFPSLGYFAGNYLTGRFAQKHGIMFMIATGNLALLATVGVITVLMGLGYVTQWTLFVPMLMVGLANGVAIPSAITGGISVRPAIAGTASGLGGSLQFGTYALAALVTGAALAAAPHALTLAIVMLAGAASSTLAGFWARTARH
jgi:DHA1 family bicyclomycin/chloramphenicol resistance-like MFS transporter